MNYIYTGKAENVPGQAIIEPTTFGMLADYALPTELRGQVEHISETSVVPSISI